MAYNKLYDGTSAYKIEEYYEYNKKAQEKQEEHRSVVRERSRVSVRKIVAVTLLVFAVSVSFLWTNAVLIQSSAEVSELTQELEDSKARNTQLAFDITSGVNLEDVEEKAISEFGMQKPESYQNVYVDVVQSDYTKMNVTDEGESNIISEMIKSLKSFLAYIG